MNLLLAFLASVLRWALGVVFGALVVRSIIPADLARAIQSEASVEIATWLCTVILPLWWIALKNSAIIARIRTALELPAGSTPADLTRRLKSDVGPFGTLIVIALVAVLPIAGCGTVPDVLPAPAAIDSLPAPAAIDSIVTADDANGALAKGQAIRIAARETVAALYPTLIGKDEVDAFDRIDKPFTDLYRDLRALVKAGKLEEFKARYAQFYTWAAELRPIALRGVRGGAR